MSDCVDDVVRQIQDQLNPVQLYAKMLNADPSLDPEHIKDLLRYVYEPIYNKAMVQAKKPKTCGCGPVNVDILKPYTGASGDELQYTELGMGFVETMGDD